MALLGLKNHNNKTNREMKTDRLKVRALTVGDNPEWVDGFYVCTYEHVIFNGSVGGFGTHAINPDTLCQCTGLKDKEGNLIYEGDEVVVKDFRPHPQAEFDPLAGKYDEYQDLQGFVQYHRNGRYYIGRGHLVPCDLFGFESKEITPTGKNIHDPNQ